MFGRAAWDPMRRVRRVQRDARGLAEIVGTLLLVVIVVAAAVAFSIFVAAYESQLTAEEAAAHNRSLEDIRILSVSTVSNAAEYTSLSFVAGSLDINTMTVNELLINGQYINYFTETPLGSSTGLNICALCTPGHGTVVEFNLTSLEQVTISVSLTLWNAATNPTGGFIAPYTLATSGPTNFVSISVYTTLGNDFNRIFDAPTAVGVTEQSETYSGSGYTPVVVLDGSGSIVPANDTIVSWSWLINNSAATCFELSGEKALLPQSQIPYGTYSVMLTIVDANGLVSTATIPYASTVTTPAIMACSDQGPVGSSTNLIGTGFTSGGQVTVTFAGNPLTFTGCSSGTAAGMMITATLTGGFVCAFTVPTSNMGTQTIQATDVSSKATPTATFTVTTPAVTLTPTQGLSGVTVTGSGSGFTADVTITFTISGGGTIGSASSCASGTTGTFSDCTFTVSGAGASYTVTATGSDGPFDAATTSFTITP